MVNTARCEQKIDQLTLQIEELLQELNDERRIRYDMRNQIYEYEHANRRLPVATCKIALVENALPLEEPFVHEYEQHQYMYDGQ